MTTLSATHANEIKNEIVDHLLKEKYEKLEASRKAAVIKYYNKKWKPDKESMTPEQLAEFELRRKERNEKARARYYAKQEENKQRSKDRYYRLKKEAEENKIMLENLKNNENI
jgi:hypothetical protein